MLYIIYYATDLLHGNMMFEHLNRIYFYISARPCEMYFLKLF
jgi:hypothetical protein